MKNNTFRSDVKLFKPINIWIIMEKWEILGGLLKRIGKYNVNNWNHRIIVQKLIYILQEQLGDNLGYRFNWYVRGPYCPRLADDFYNLENTEKAPIVKYTDDEINQRYDKFAELMEKYQDNKDILELVASMIYLSPTKKISNKENLLEKIKKLKPYFDNSDYPKALNLLEKIEQLERLDK